MVHRTERRRQEDRRGRDRCPGSSSATSAEATHSAHRAGVDGARPGATCGRSGSASSDVGCGSPRATTRGRRELAAQRARRAKARRSKANSRGLTAFATRSSSARSPSVSAPPSAHEEACDAFNPALAIMFLPPMSVSWEEGTRAERAPSTQVVLRACRRARRSAALTAARRPQRSTGRVLQQRTAWISPVIGLLLTPLSS